MPSMGVAANERETLHDIVSRYGDVRHHADKSADRSWDRSVKLIEFAEGLSLDECFGPELLTTLMLNNLPSKLTMKLMEKELGRLGFAGTYSDLHVPTSKNGGSSGYGFINFNSASDAHRAAEVLNGHVFSVTSSMKRCCVTSAAFRGSETSFSCVEQDSNRGVEADVSNYDRTGLSTQTQEWLGPEPTVTTLMLKNIPCKLTRESMTEELRLLGFEGVHDAMHIPSRTNGSNKGYGFINFISAHDARRAADTLNGYMFSGTCSTKRCQVTTAAFQGREATLRFAKQDLEPKQSNVEESTCIDSNTTFRMQ
eukprot:TRINITY_DN10588_c1_g4_i2.p1 TRINITY_DN10588_c1_g4~~TRINITY_DN10588_c1_g4_i2.p1  ORF type:complete len:311 (+),score=40.72 TRINITY_DN10588_c1_g4_i2:115-1047(+)